MSKSPSINLDDQALIAKHDHDFHRLYSRGCELIKSTPEKDLYQQSVEFKGGPPFSVAENVVRGTGTVEQTFGGITANLWDDPFEWTLPETLSSASLILEYLDEVEKLRKQAFLSFTGDADLLKKIMLPSGESQTLVDLLTEAAVKAAKYYQQAEAILAVLAPQVDLASR